MKRLINCVTSGLATVVALLVVVNVVQGGIFLVGAQVYASNSDGSVTSNLHYQYSTNSSTTHFPLKINGGSGLSIAFPLLDGDNAFTFTGAPCDPGDFAGLSLFFNEQG